MSVKGTVLWMAAGGGSKTVATTLLTAALAKGVNLRSVEFNLRAVSIICNSLVDVRLVST